MSKRLFIQSLAAFAASALLSNAPAQDKPREVFAYFVSTDKVHAPRNAMGIMRRLGPEPPK